MRGYNRVILMGNLAKDPELRYTPSGKATAACDVAVNKAWKDDRGELHESVDFIRCVTWGGTAEIWAKYLKKGSGIHLEGRLATRSYTDKNGVKRYVTEVIVERSNFVGGAKTSEASAAPTPGQPYSQPYGQPQSYRGAMAAPQEDEMQNMQFGPDDNFVPAGSDEADIPF